MGPYDESDAARMTRSKVGVGAAPQPPGPIQNAVTGFAKWATTPMGVPQSRMKTPQEVMAQPGVPSPQPEAPKVGVQAPAREPMGTGAAAHLPAWAADQVQRGGGNPAGFEVQGSQLMSARSPQAISADISSHPPITTASLTTPAQVPSIGVQGAAPAGQPGVRGPAASGGQAYPSGAPSGSGTEDRVLASMLKAHDTLVKQGPIPYGASTQDMHQQYPARVMASAQAINDYRQGTAKASAMDPRAKIGMIDDLLKDPARLKAAMAIEGHDPRLADNVPRPGAEAVGGQDINGWLEANRDQDLPAVLASVPHRASPEVTAALQRHIDSRYADEGSWQDAAGQLPGIDNYQYSGPSWLAGPAKLFSYGMDRLTPGGAERVPNPAVDPLMKRYGLRPPAGSGY